MLRLILASDSHNKHKQINMPEGDIFIFAGDFSGRGYHGEVRNFLKWLVTLPYQHILFCAGNHDLSFESEVTFKNQVLDEFIYQSGHSNRIHYLEHQSITIDGINYFGSPYSVEFCNWAFAHERDSEEAKKLWMAIPSNTNILFTHGASHKILDRSCNIHPRYPQDTGCKILKKRIKELPNLWLAQSGHIHECRGLDDKTYPPVWFVNASICNLNYIPCNKPVVIDINNNGEKKIIDF